MYATWILAYSLSSYLQQYKTLPEISISVFFFFFLRCRASVEQQNKRAIQLLPHLREILACNLQPAVYTI